MHSMKETLFVVLCFLCLVWQTSWAESKLTQVNELPQFPLKSGANGTNYEKLPDIRVFTAFQHAESAGSEVRFNPDGRPLNETHNWVEIYRQSADADLGVICSAPYPITISTNIIAQKIGQSYSVTQNGSIWTHQLRIFTPSSGFISCSSLANPAARSTEVKIYIDPRSKDECQHCGTFVPVENKELILEKETESGQKQYLASCRLNSWFINGSVVRPELYYGENPINYTTWDPVKGFSFILPNDDEKGAQDENSQSSTIFMCMAIKERTVNCKLGNRFLKFTVPQNVKHIPRVEIHGNHMKIQSDKLTIVENGGCADYSQFSTNLYFCRWASSCPLKLQLSRSTANSSESHVCTYKEPTKVTEIEYELTTDLLEPELPQGIVKYVVKRTLPPSESDDGMTYFTGLDNNIYSVPGGYLDESVIQLVEFPRLFYKNETTNYTFTCRTIDFVIAPRVYLIVGMQNGSAPRIFTNGKTLTDGRLNRVSEYNFQLDLDVNMAKIECHGMDPYSKGGQWRSSGSIINVKYTRAPFVKPENGDKGHQQCIIRGNCTLECPIIGEPMPAEFFWQTPRRNETNNERSLKLVNLEERDAGDYVCSAKSPHGNATYTYTVSVEDPFMDGWTKAAIATIGTGLALVATVFAWKYYMTKKYLGGYTPAQIKNILKGNRDAAKAAPDGEEKARHKEFAKFIPPRSLEVEPTVANKLGEGYFGVVYRCTYKNQPSAAKTFEKGLSNDQMYDILMEMKIMDYIGDHDHIIKFHGVDISRLRSGQLYMVMELSERGSLESYLRKELYFEYSVMQQSDRFAEMDDRLKMLLGFCLNIISAMDYLHTKNIIHGDLSTRNVLLFEGNIAKLADFGHARQLYDGIYRATKKNIPYQWASVELLTTRTFSTASDAWAFGVTAWEIFELGETPFRHTPYNEAFVEAIQDGHRLSKPQLASDELYSVLMSSWHTEAAQRPSFRSLHGLFEQLEKTMTHKNLKAFTTHNDMKAVGAPKDLRAPAAPKNLSGSIIEEYVDIPEEIRDLPPSYVRAAVQTNSNNNGQCTIKSDNAIYTSFPCE